ncbi:MAG: hypothetical protein RIR18_734 [Pseudomonadota bacterium]|jgi:hypothetical protein
MRYSIIGTEATLKTIDDDIRKTLAVTAFLIFSVGGVFVYSAVNTWLL